LDGKEVLHPQWLQNGDFRSDIACSNFMMAIGQDG
jgi:hypothetical protein